MPSFTQLFILATLAAVSSAELSVVLANCPNAQLVQNGTIPVGDNLVQYTSHLCAAGGSLSRRGLFDSFPLCILFNTCPPPPPRVVCTDACTTSCNNLSGVLPPISQDCQTVVNAINIFQGKQPDQFTVEANHLETLTFGTCSYFFENLSTEKLNYCWSSLSTEGTAAGTACFPPVQPFFSEGLCKANDATWAVGAAHS